MNLLRVLWALCVSASFLHAAEDPAKLVPAHAPRSLVLADRIDAFRRYCANGAGAKPFAKIKADLDREWLAWPLPAEPVTSCPAPPTSTTTTKRTSGSGESSRSSTINSARGSRPPTAGKFPRTSKPAATAPSPGSRSGAASRGSAVLWPERGTKPASLNAALDSHGVLAVKRPDGKTDFITLTDESLRLK